MSQRKHMDSSVKCGGCGREFGIIQHSHITHCHELAQLGITNRTQYSARFGSTLSNAALKSSIDNIVKFNDTLDDSGRVAHAKKAHAIAVSKNPDLYSQGGIKGSAALWSKKGYKKIHSARISEMNAKGSMTQIPNKLENKFWGMIGSDKIEYVSFKFWKTVEVGGKYVHITPDFKVAGTNAVIEVYGNYWHRNDIPQDRINLWKSAGCECIVIWENEINKNPTTVVEIVNQYISKNLHECVTTANISG